MISNKFFPLHVNKNGYDSITNWTHGFTSVLSINDFDQNFRPYLYLFKYMRKSQRIGKSFIHTSKNLRNYETLTSEHIPFDTYTAIHQEQTETVLNGRKLKFYRDYMKLSDTMQSQIN